MADADETPDVRQATRPRWATDYLTDQQRQLSPLLVWITLIRKAASLDRDAKPFASELYICLHTLPKNRTLEWSPGFDLLRLHTGIGSDNLTKAWRKLAEAGWLHVIPGRPNTYRPTWPASDCMAGDAPICGAVTSSKGNKPKVCENRPGFGTVTPGVGPCKHHGGTAKSGGSGRRRKVAEPDEPAFGVPGPEGLSPEVRTPQVRRSGLVSPEVRTPKSGPSGAKVFKEQVGNEQQMKDSDAPRRGRAAAPPPPETFTEYEKRHRALMIREGEELSEEDERSISSTIAHNYVIMMVGDPKTGAEMSTIEGMLSNGVHPKAIVNTVLKGRGESAAARGKADAYLRSLPDDVRESFQDAADAHIAAHFPDAGPGFRVIFAARLAQRQHTPAETKRALAGAR